MKLSTNHPIVRKAFKEGASIGRPAYKITYFMTQREYTSAMNVIYNMWNPSTNSGHFTFMQHKLHIGFFGLLCTTKINP